MVVKNSPGILLVRVKKSIHTSANNSAQVCVYGSAQLGINIATDGNLRTSKNV